MKIYDSAALLSFPAKDRMRETEKKRDRERRVCVCVHSVCVGPKLFLMSLPVAMCV